MKKNILTLMFRHETNVFSPHKATRESFRKLTDLSGEGVLTEFRGVRTEVGAFIEVFGNREDIELIPTVALYSIPCGKVADDVYDYALNSVMDAIRAKGIIDGFIIEFHGAMVTDTHDDAEGDFLEAVRGVVGDKVPIVATLDLHANVTDKMVKYANALIPYEKAEGIQKTRSIIHDLKGKKSVAILIGPEGGFDEKEVEDAMNQGVFPVTLGRRILRTETAGLTMLSILMFEFEEE